MRSNGFPVVADSLIMVASRWIGRQLRGSRGVSSPGASMRCCLLKVGGRSYGINGNQWWSAAVAPHRRLPCLFRNNPPNLDKLRDLKYFKTPHN